MTEQRQPDKGQENAVGMSIVKARSGELAASASAAQAKAEIEAAYVIALQRPRSEANARDKILAACRRPAFAKNAWYAKPCGGREPARGPSIRLAEVCLQAWGNARVTTHVTWEDSEIRKIKVVVTDMENNMSYDEEVVLRKIVERRQLRDGQTKIGERQNSYGQMVYLVEASDDDMLTKTNAARSKSLRNCAMRLIPYDIIADAADVVALTMHAEVQADPRAAGKKTADAFSQKFGVAPSELEKYLGHPLMQLTPGEIIELREVYTALEDGEATWPAVLADKLGRSGNTAIPAGTVKPQTRTEQLKQRTGATSAPAPVGEAKLPAVSEPPAPVSAPGENLEAEPPPDTVKPEITPPAATTAPSKAAGKAAKAAKADKPAKTPAPPEAVEREVTVTIAAVVPIKNTAGKTIKIKMTTSEQDVIYTHDQATNLACQEAMKDAQPITLIVAKTGEDFVALRVKA